MAQLEAGFEWPVVLESRACVLVGSKVFEPWIEERRRANLTQWENQNNWKFGFYFGKCDTRLWVPKPGSDDPNLRIINFGHPLGRKAFRILMLGYAIGVVALGLLVLALLQVGGKT